MIEDLAARVFQARNHAHRQHWRTGSYAAHMAIGAFYDEVIDAVDAVIECRQGGAGLIGPFTVVDVEPDTPIIQYLIAEADWIESNRDTLAAGSPPVANLIDSLADVYRTTIYKLRSLA